MVVDKVYSSKMNKNKGEEMIFDNDLQILNGHEFASFSNCLPFSAFIFLKWVRSSSIFSRATNVKSPISYAIIEVILSLLSLFF